MSTYYAILTAVGEAKLANATALGSVLQLSRMAVGDGNGNLPTPNRTQTALVRETYRADLNQLSVDPNNASQIIAELVIPETEGGYWLREMGIYDAAGDLFAVANCPPSYKPQLAEGSGRTQVMRMVLIVSSTASVQLKIDPSVVLATRDYVATTVAAALVNVRGTADPLMDGVAAPGVGNKLSREDHKHPTDSSRAPLASPVFTGTPKAPTPATADNSTLLATTAFVKAVVAALVASSPAALDTLNELAAALGNDANFATTMTNALALKAPLASPVLTGVPKAPTPAAGDNTTQLATTAFVQAALASARPVMHVRDEKAPGTDGGTITTGAWRTRDLNTVVINTIPGASLAANQVTLPAGTYDVIARAPGYACGQQRCGLYTAAGAQLGQSNNTRANNDTGVDNWMFARITLAVATTLDLRHRCTVTLATFGFGRAASFDTNEVYGEGIFIKVA